MRIPAPTFSLRPISKNWPNELHETIDATPELIAWATAALPRASEALTAARAAERGALTISRGDASWRRAGGPNTSMNADHAARMLGMLKLLAAGEFNGDGDGWIDRREWLLMIDHVASLQ